MSHRPLVLVSGLTVGDYLLWNWSLNGNHDVLALISGVSLPPLAVACMWLLAISAARLIAHSASLPIKHARRRALRPRRHSRKPAISGLPLEEPTASATQAGSSSSKLAA